MELSPPFRAFVEAQPVARLATLDPSGRPHVVPVCFAFAGGRCWSVVDGKPKRHARLQRLRNVEANPAATLLCDVYDDDWERLAWAMLRCRAEVVEGGGPGHGAAIAALRAKYPQYRAMALEDRPAIALAPERATGWGLERWTAARRRGAGGGR